jgi:hypothetical protein
MHIFGERCSGTNFVSQLLTQNFKTLSSTHEFGHKHFPWWFDTPEENETLKLLGYDTKQTRLENSDQSLFIVVIRHPYDWLKSFYRTPHHVHPDLLGKGFFHFISQTWKPAGPKSYQGVAYNLIDGKNPFSHHPFENILELRTCKMQNYLKMGSLVKNFLLVRYEDARENPQGLIDFISAYYEIAPDPLFTPITTYKGQPDTPIYKKQVYAPIKTENLLFINEHLDWELEHELGYFEEPIKEKSKFSKLLRHLEKTFRRKVLKFFRN